MMEALLSLAFDNLSSYDGAKIRKGLRQVEGLLAQICLSRQKSTPTEKRRSVVAPGSAQPTPKELACLKEDPAFREFFKLQEGFECNCAAVYVACSRRW
jgi:Cell division control protein 14, SIN component